MLSADAMAELMPSASGVILTLMSSLRHSVVASLVKPISQTNNNTIDSFSGDPAVVSLTHHSSLLVVLRHVVECLFKTGRYYNNRNNFVYFKNSNACTEKWFAFVSFSGKFLVAYTLF